MKLCRALLELYIVRWRLNVVRWVHTQRFMQWLLLNIGSATITA